MADFLHVFVPGKSERTLLLLHGTGGTEQDLLGIGQTLDPEASLLSPRGKILERGMPRFFKRLAEGVFDEEDLIFRTHEIAEFIEGMRAKHGLKEIVAVGYSNGANIAGSLFLLRPGVLQGGVLLRAMVPLVPKVLPDLSGVPVLISAGTHDPIIPVENPRELERMLTKAGAKVTLEFEEAGHGLTQGTIDSAGRWIAAR